MALVQIPKTPQDQDGGLLFSHYDPWQQAAQLKNGREPQTRHGGVHESLSFSKKSSSSRESGECKKSIFSCDAHSIDIPKQTVEMSIWFEFFWYVDEEFKDDERKKYVTDDEEEKKVLNKKQETTDTHGHVYEPACSVQMAP